MLLKLHKFLRIRNMSSLASYLWFRAPWSHSQAVGLDCYPAKLLPVDKVLLEHGHAHYFANPDLWTLAFKKKLAFRLNWGWSITPSLLTMPFAGEFSSLLRGLCMELLRLWQLVFPRASDPSKSEKMTMVEAAGSIPYLKYNMPSLLLYFTDPWNRVGRDCTGVWMWGEGLTMGPPWRLATTEQVSIRRSFSGYCWGSSDFPEHFLEATDVSRDMSRSDLHYKRMTSVFC